MNQQKLHHINNHFETVIKLSDYTLAPPFNTTIKISKDFLQILHSHPQAL